MVWADAGRIRARVVDRSRQRDPSRRGAETKDRRTRRPAPAALAAGEAVSTDLDTVSGRAGRTAIVATPLQTGLFSGFGEEPVARAGHEPGRVPQEAESRADAARLMIHPGVGPVTALAFVLTLGPVARFRRSKQVVSYLGLNPKERSSGDKQHTYAISKQGRRNAVDLARERAANFSESRREPHKFGQR